MEPDREKALRSEYESAQWPDHELAARYNVAISTLRRMIRKKGWSKRLPPSEEKVQAAVHLFSFDPLEQATFSAAQVVSVHRTDVARLRSLSSTLVERLGLVLSGQASKIVDAEGNPLPCLGSRESPADLLEKLSRVMVRTTEIERQAYGLKTFNPEVAATDAQLQEELDKLTTELENVAANKAAG